MFDIIVETDKGKFVTRERCTLNEAGIGKARDNVVLLRGWRVAAHHAVIHRTSEGLSIEDLTERDATLVNGEPVEQYGPLHTTDVIEIGGFHIKVGVVKEPEGAAVEDEDADEEVPAFDGLQTMIGVAHHQEIDGSDELSKTLANLRKSEKFKWRNRVHEELLAMMDLRRTDISTMDEDTLRNHVQTMIGEIITNMGAKLPEDVDRDRLAVEVLNEAVGLGPLEELLEDESVTEIMVNKYDEIYIERSGRLTRSDVTFSSDDAVMSAIERIVSPLGRRIDESSPMVDARLRDGSRVNAIIPPLALRGPCLTIRKFSKKTLSAEDLLNYGAINQPMLDFLEMAVKHRKNIIVSGGTGSGKTTLLNMLSNFIPSAERIVTVEDAAELQLVQPHLVSLEARPPNLEGKGAIPIRDLVKNCLRMRPDRIVVGECRGGEALDMLQAMNTGHDGSLTTAHANTPRDLIARLEVMVMMSGMDLPITAIREQVASAVDIVVQQTRFSDGSRKIVDISEITGVENGIVQMQSIFGFHQQGFDETGRVRGYYCASGAVPEFYEELRERGLPVDMSIFKQERQDEFA